MATLPTITGINPTSGPNTGGTTLLIAGTDLTGATLVTFSSGANSVTAPPTSSTATSVSVVTPAWTFPVGPARVTVTTPGGDSVQPVFFTYTTIVPPTLTSLTPTTVPSGGGTVITITGSELRYATGVTITQGATSAPATSFAILSNTALAFVTPPAPVGPGTATVTVTNAAGTSTPGVDFTYSAPRSLPVVTAVTPTGGPAAGANSVAVTGTDLAFATQVDFGTAPSTQFSVASDSSITATAPPGTGTVTVTVTGANGVGTVGVPYTYSAVVVPTITTLTPSSGPLVGGNTVTITGTDLTGASSVSFNGTPATSFVVLSPTTLNAIVPASATAGAINLTVTANGQTSAPATYTYITAPAPATIFPTAGIISGGTAVAIDGTDLTGTSSVLFGTSPATGVTVVGDTQVDSVSPAHTVGTVPVTVVTPGGNNSTLLFSYQPPPVITSVSPATGPVAGGTTVSVNGAGLFNVTGVFFETTPATSFTIASDNLITAVAPAGTGAVAITANTAAAFSNGVVFQYETAPTLTTLTPSSGSILGGNNVSITGTGFTNAQNVFFGSLPTTYTILSDTTISAVAPTVGVTGPVSVTVQNAGGLSAGLPYTYT